MPAEFCGVKLVCQFLCFCDVTDIGKRIVVALVSYAVGVKHMLHQFSAIYVDLDVERDSCLYFYEHESKFLVQIVEIIEIIVKAFGISGLHHKFPLVTAIYSGSFAGFQSL